MAGEQRLKVAGTRKEPPGRGQGDRDTRDQGWRGRRDTGHADTAEPWARARAEGYRSLRDYLAGRSSWNDQRQGRGRS